MSNIAIDIVGPSRGLVDQYCWLILHNPSNPTGSLNPGSLYFSPSGPIFAPLRSPSKAPPVFQVNVLVRATPDVAASSLSPIA